MSGKQFKKRFTKQEKQYELTFETDDPADEMAGFECVMSGVSLKEFIEITQLSAALETPEGRTPENIEKQFTVIGDLLVDWNLDDETEQPVPCSYEGLKGLDIGFVMKIMSGYMQAITSVPKASGDDSPSGATSEELSLGLGSASTAQAS
jgi:hypothetical protein